MQPSPIARLEQVIGANIRRVRENRRLDQAALAARLGQFIDGKPWTRQNISAMENGGRAFTARDLMAIAYNLEIPVSALLLIPPETESVQLRPELVLSREQLEPAGWQSDETTDNLAAITDRLASISERLGQLIDDAYELQEEARALMAPTVRLRHIQALEAKGATIEEDYR